MAVVAAGVAKARILRGVLAVFEIFHAESIHISPKRHDFRFAFANFFPDYTSIDARFTHTGVLNADLVKFFLNASRCLEFLQAYFRMRVKVAAHADDVVLLCQNAGVDCHVRCIRSFKEKPAVGL